MMVRMASTPSVPGIRRSIRHTSGRCSRYSATARSPFSASATNSSRSASGASTATGPVRTTVIAGHEDRRHLDVMLQVPAGDSPFGTSVHYPPGAAPRSNRARGEGPENSTTFESVRASPAAEGPVRVRGSEDRTQRSTCSIGGRGPMNRWRDFSCFRSAGLAGRSLARRRPRRPSGCPTTRRRRPSPSLWRPWLRGIGWAVQLQWLRQGRGDARSAAEAARR